jgi:hypothetical protein
MNRRRLDSRYDVTFGPCDPLNLGCGYYIKIERDGVPILHTSRHPDTGKDLDYASCVEIAGQYGPPRAVRA